MCALAVSRSTRWVCLVGVYTVCVQEHEVGVSSGCVHWLCPGAQGGCV